MKKVVCIHQVYLVTAIMDELYRQYPGLYADSKTFNSIVKAVNSINSAFDGIEIDINDEEEDGN